jgi:hypothetical protein
MKMGAFCLNKKVHPYRNKDGQRQTLMPSAKGSWHELSMD